MKYRGLAKVHKQITNMFSCIQYCWNNRTLNVTQWFMSCFADVSENWACYEHWPKRIFWTPHDMKFTSVSHDKYENADSWLFSIGYYILFTKSLMCENWKCNGLFIAILLRQIQTICSHVICWCFILFCRIRSRNYMVADTYLMHN